MEEFTREREEKKSRHCHPEALVCVCVCVLCVCVLCVCVCVCVLCVYVCMQVSVPVYTLHSWRFRKGRGPYYIHCMYSVCVQVSTALTMYRGSGSM